LLLLLLVYNAIFVKLGVNIMVGLGTLVKIPRLGNSTVAL